MSLPNARNKGRRTSQQPPWALPPTHLFFGVLSKDRRAEVSHGRKPEAVRQRLAVAPGLQAAVVIATLKVAVRLLHPVRLLVQRARGAAAVQAARVAAFVHSQLLMSSAELQSRRAGETGQATAEVRAAAPALEKAAIRKYAVKGWEDDACFDTLSPEVETARYGWWWSDEAKGREGQILKTVAGRQAGRQAGLLSASTHSSTHQQCRLSSANFIFISVWRHIGHKST